MGTFSEARNEYDDPQVPAEFDTGRNLRKAYLRGWCRGIWTNTPARVYYSRQNMERAFQAGHAAARQARRDRGEPGV